MQFFSKTNNQNKINELPVGTVSGKLGCLATLVLRKLVFE